MSSYNIKKELSLYNIRKIDNTNIMLEIEELQAESKDNIHITNEIELLQKKIKINELKNKKIDNILSMLNEEQKKIIKCVYIDNLNINKTAKRLYMSTKTVKRKLNKIFNKLEYFEK